MRAPPLATHPLDQPVRTPAQAQAVIDSLDAWRWLPWDGSAVGEQLARRLELIPGLAQAGPDFRHWQQAVRWRMAEAVAVRAWADRQAWLDFPELGMEALRDLVGFTIDYHNNGPDAPVSMAIHAPRYRNGQANDDYHGSPRRQAFDRLRRRWDTDLPTSPLCGLLHVLANRQEKRWVADFTSPHAVFDSLLEPENLAAYRAAGLDAGLPDAPARRPAVSRL